MNNRNLCINILIFLILFNENIAVIFKMTKVYCESYNESWVNIPHCRLRAKSRNVTKLTIIANILYPAHNIHVHCVLKKKANDYKPFMVDINFDGCAFMRKHNHPIMNIIFTMIRNYTSINHTCPYVGEQYVKDLSLHHELLGGLPLPTGDYLLLFTWIFNKKPQFVTNVYFNFVEDF